MTALHRPRATYRLQFNETFRFDDGRRIVPYLAALGISHVYASPILMARPGSRHGYDIVDHTRLNPEIGSRQDFDSFVDTLHRHDMGLILDFVPNHMGVGPDNPWWTDVLEWGKASPYASYFDIDWQPAEPTLAGKVLLPVLGDHYGAVLERGELQLDFDAGLGAFSVRGFGTSYPINARSYPLLLRSAAERSAEEIPELVALGEAFVEALKGRGGSARQRIRRQHIEALKKELAEFVASRRDAQLAIGAAVDELNGSKKYPATFDSLHALLEKQNYRLSFWRVAAHEMNYRRFFDINDLAGLRMEHADLFRASHALIGELIAAGQVQGLRLDHIDGLRDPQEYLERLQSLSHPSSSTPLYVVVEKILAQHESLRDEWPVSGTSGYEFMAAVNGLFVDSAAERFLKRFYARFARRRLDPDEMRIDAKRQVMRETLGSELGVLANLFNRLAKQSRETRDYSLTGLRQALTDVIANFPVYRTYVTDGRITAQDRRDIDWAVAKGRRTTPSSDTSIYDFIRNVLTLDILELQPRRHRRRDTIDAASKFQQYTGPVMAKAVEDTVFYRYVCLVSLNEVGGDVDRFGVSPSAFHEMNRRRLKDRPRAMLATATHDHKRGEDLRARLNVLSEVPGAWARRVRRWSVLNERKRRHTDDGPAPDSNDEYLLYQTIVGAWPGNPWGPDFTGIESLRDRLAEYMTKAVREAKRITSWASPNEEYEAALSQFIAEILDPKLSQPFLEDIGSFADSIAPAGAVNGLGQTVLKLTSPGVPDIYQGSELWDLSLVDPDNRRPVDYEVRRRCFPDSARATPEHLLAAWRDGRIKQYVVLKLLSLRRERPALFEAGQYEAIEPAGALADHVLAFARSADDGDALLVVVPRLVSSLLGTSGIPLPVGWQDTQLELPAPFRGRRVVDVLSGRSSTLQESGRLAVATALADLPVAVLTT